MCISNYGHLLIFWICGLGGHCRLYKEMNCKDEDAVEIWEGKGAEPLQCPGLSAVGNPIWFKSMKCRKD